MGHRHKQAAGLWKNVSGLHCVRASPRPQGEKASTNINLLCGEPRAGVRCSSGKQLGMHPGSWWPALDRAPDPPASMPWQQAGGLEADRGNRIRICEHVYEEGEKTCVNCMMKRKSLVLNEKSESGPEPAGGLGVPGVCGEQLEEVRGPRRDADHGRPVPVRADHHSREKAGVAPSFIETDMHSQRGPLSRIWNSFGSMWLCPRGPLLPGLQGLHPAAPERARQ